jgi:hypothetical protein
MLPQNMFRLSGEVAVGTGGLLAVALWVLLAYLCHMAYRWTAGSGTVGTTSISLSYGIQVDCWQWYCEYD